MLDTEEVGNSLRELIQRRSWDELRSRIRDMNPSDVADLIIALPPEEEVFVFRVLPKDQAGEVFSYLPPDHQEELIAALTNEEVMEEWPERWERALKQSFPRNWPELASSCGEGLRKLLRSDEDLQEATFLCANGLLAGRNITAAQLSANQADLRLKRWRQPRVNAKTAKDRQGPPRADQRILGGRRDGRRRAI